MLRNIVTRTELARLASLPSHQTGQSSRVLRTYQARFFNTEDKIPRSDKESSGHEATPEGDHHDVPMSRPDMSIVQPDVHSEVLDIDRSRPLPPPAYAATRLEHVTGADQDLKFDHHDNQVFEEANPTDKRGKNDDTSINNPDLARSLGLNQSSGDQRDQRK